MPTPFRQDVDSTLWTRENLAWAAGVYEGEGTVYKTAAGQIQMKVKMSDEDVIRKFHKIIGTGTVVPYNDTREGSENYKPLWVWRSQCRAEVMAVLVALFTWLGERRRAKITEVLSHA